MKDQYQINPQLSWRFIENEILILDSNGTQSSHDLNPIGSFIFESIHNGLSTEETLNQLTEKYKASADIEVIKKDFSDFLNHLNDLKIFIPKES